LCTFCVLVVCKCIACVVMINFWNLLFQGLRAFLPKAELLNRVNNFKELKENVSCNTLEFLVPELLLLFLFLSGLVL